MKKLHFLNIFLAITILVGCKNKESKSKSKHINIENIVDLTHTLNNSFPFIPHKVTFAFELKPMVNVKEHGVAANQWVIHEHLGTQIDAPNHFIDGGNSLEKIEAKDLIVPCVIIDISEKSNLNPDAQLTTDDITKWESKYGKIPDNSCVFMYSGYEKHIKTKKYIGIDSTDVKHFPGISKEAALFLMKKRNVAGVGVDVISLDPGFDNTYASHKIILGEGKWILECVANLNKLPPIGATVFVGAPKIEGATGGFTRIFAVW